MFFVSIGPEPNLTAELRLHTNNQTHTDKLYYITISTNILGKFRLDRNVAISATVGEVDNNYLLYYERTIISLKPSTLKE